MPFCPPIRARSRCIFSASDSSAPDPTFFESTSIRSAPVRVSSAHRSNRSFSSGRGFSEVSRVPSGDSLRARGCGPARSGLANTRLSVSACRVAVSAAGGAGESAAIAAVPSETSIAYADSQLLRPRKCPTPHLRSRLPAPHGRRRMRCIIAVRRAEVKGRSSAGLASPIEPSPPFENLCNIHPGERLGQVAKRSMSGVPRHHVHLGPGGSPGGWNKHPPITTALPRTCDSAVLQRRPLSSSQDRIDPAL